MHLFATQNVRGFKATDGARLRWMQAWKKRLQGQALTGVCVQETHVTSAREANRLERMWCRVWGIKWDSERAWSFWSVSQHSAAGVAILLNPHASDACVAWHRPSWTAHVIAVECGSFRLVCVYAPGRHPKAVQDAFFASLGRF